jgi:hypothetical protein
MGSPSPWRKFIPRPGTCSGLPAGRQAYVAGTPPAQRRKRHPFSVIGSSSPICRGGGQLSVAKGVRRGEEGKLAGVPDNTERFLIFHLAVAAWQT